MMKNQILSSHMNMHTNNSKNVSEFIYQNDKNESNFKIVRHLVFFYK